MDQSPERSDGTTVPRNEFRKSIAIAGVFAEMRGRAMGRFAEYGLEGATQLDFVAEMRFVGQAFEVPVTLDPAGLESLTARELKRLFGEAHQRIYFHGAAADKAIEAVSFRLGVTAPLADMPRLREVAVDGSPPIDIEIFDGRLAFVENRLRLAGVETLHAF